jgi:U3 small nucleolar RNA-associated protein 5
MPPPARPSKSGGKRKSAASADPHDPLAALAPGAAPATDRAMDHDAGEDDEPPRGGGGKTLGERLRSIERSAVDDAGPSSSSDDDDAGASRKGKTKKGTKDAAAAKDLDPSRSRRNRASAASEAREAAIAEALGTSSPAAPPKADSLAVLLAQALLAEDRALIERCLSVADPDVVRNTVARLQPHSAIQLLRAALDRMRSKPSRGEQLARWMRTVLLHHAGHCATSASARRAVAELRSVADAHAAMQPSLLSLLGRLDLLLHARRSRGRRGRGEGGRPGDGGGRPGGDGGEDVPGDAAFVSTYDEAEDDAELVEDADDDDAEEASEWETDDGSDDDDDDDDADGDGGSSDDASSDESGDDESDDEE